MTVIHTPFVCELCGPSLLCGTCGLNACSGGTGKAANGSDCPDCDDAYHKYCNMLCEEQDNE